jgi:hypothetical protein
MPEWLPKALKTALIALVVGCVVFNIYCIVGYQFAKPPIEPIPSLIVGIPVAFVVAIVAFIFSAVRNSTN